MSLTTLEKKVLAGFAATVVVVVVMGVAAALSIRAFVNASRWVDHTYDVLQNVADLQTQVQLSELHTRAYLITGAKSRLADRQQAIRQVDQLMNTTRDLTSDNPLEQKRLADLGNDVTGLQQVQADMIAARVRPQASTNIWHAGMLNTYGRLRQAYALLSAMRTTEKQLLNQRLAHAHATAIYSILIFGAMVLFMFGIKAYLFRRIKDEVRERERMDQALLQTTRSLETTNKELESFSYSISHDLRSPLRAVNGFARILETEYGVNLDTEGRRIIDVIVRNSNKMEALINDLLAFSRVGRSPLNDTEINMQELVEKVQGDLRAAGDYPHTRFVVADLPLAEGDPALLSQVWSNLIGNAFKYSSKSESPEVRVDGRVNGREVIYSIHDNGVGFDMRYYRKLFGVFQRLHSDAEFPGTGVGLAITQRIVTRHGGRVWAEAAPEKGATFSFSLPKGHRYERAEAG